MITEMTDPAPAIEAGITHNDNHIFFEWSDGDGVVYFTSAMKGRSLSIHIAATPENIEYIRDAANEFCDYLFDRYQWCRMIMSIVESQSVVNLALKCGFDHVGYAGKAAIIMRMRQEVQ